MSTGKSTSKTIGLIAGPAAFLLVTLFMEPEGLSPQGTAVLASAIWISLWWISEAVPIAVTALLPIILFPLTGGLDIGATTASYGHRFVFLYLGGFMLSIAIQKWNLHRRIALNIISLIGTNLNLIVLGFMIATAFLSMWISNTATAVMMLPIAMAIVHQLEEGNGRSGSFGKAIMISIAYSASIGGISTLIGTPPNLVLAGVLEEIFGIEIGFAQWMKLGLPVSILLLFICWNYLTKVAFRFEIKSFPGGISEIKKQRKALGKIAFEERIVMFIFVLMALLWIFRPLIQKLLPGIDDTVIAIFAAVLIFLFPSSEKGKPLITWEEAVRIPWGIILLFGGGMALAEGFQTSGLALWIGQQLSLFEGLSIFLIVLFLVAMVNFLTEVTSNLATTAMILPVLAPLALTLDVHPFTLMVAATLAASCAFLLPVATPPNAVVFGSGYLRVPDMARTGIWMNLISIFIITLLVFYLMPLVWGIDISAFPGTLGNP